MYRSIPKQPCRATYIKIAPPGPVFPNSVMDEEHGGTLRLTLSRRIAARFMSSVMSRSWANSVYPPNSSCIHQCPHPYIHLSIRSHMCSMHCGLGKLGNIAMEMRAGLWPCRALTNWRKWYEPPSCVPFLMVTMRGMVFRVYFHDQYGQLNPSAIWKLQRGAALSVYVTQALVSVCIDLK